MVGVRLLADGACVPPFPHCPDCGTDNTVAVEKSSATDKAWHDSWPKTVLPLPRMNPGNTTIRDVARLSGVSPMTVSRVINDSERVSPETRKRVEDAISELGYVPSRLARGLSRQRTGTLALIVPDVANPFFTLIVRGAEDVARRAGYRVLLCDTRADLPVENEVIEEMIAHRVEGIVVAPVSDRSREHLRRLGKFGVPFVLVDRTVPGIEADAVLGDSEAGARQLVDHLIS